tara:strand:+ start:191 stop:1882 length:1692 start_codon:yes stop_codon:yes gene_type:complete
MRVADYIAKFLKRKKIKDIFMLTGYGAMYLNDAIKLNNIKYYATRNEATAPIMAAAYARLNKNVGVACVTAGPGATNAIPGLAEAFVDSSPIIVFSGQVELSHTTFNTNLNNIRTFGTAEINILPIVKPLTKYCEIIKRPNDTKYILEKAFYYANEGRPGPVWIDIPLDVQNKTIIKSSLKKFIIPKKRINANRINVSIKKLVNYLHKSNKPIFFVGNGVKQSNTSKIIDTISSKLNIPIFTSRLANDLYPHNKKNIFGLAGIKGSRFCRNIMNEADLVISFGCRLSPQLIGHKFDEIKKAKVISIDVEKDELIKKGCKIDFAINADLKNIIPKLENVLFKKSSLDKRKFKKWIDHCIFLENKNPMINKSYRVNPIDLYYFMHKIDKISNSNHILVTDAGSNYYAGGQVWHYNSGQKEVTSGTNAAMGLTIPLSIGSSIAKPNKQILAVTGDGSLELNIQELKTISHYNLNIKLFVINNGGYVSMHKWQDKIAGRRLDTPKDTGDGTLNLKNIAKAFELRYYKIKDFKNIEKDLKLLTSNKQPYFVEVMTDNKQKIFNAIIDN